MEESTNRNKRLCKVKIGKDDLDRIIVTVKIEVPSQNGDMESVVLESKDLPHPDLVSALDAMAEHLLVHAEFPSTWLEQVKIISYTVTHTNEVQGLVITGKKELENCNAPLIINTPHFTRESYNEEDDSDIGIFSFECGQHLDVLEREAIAYFEGKRAQLELFGKKEDGTNQGELNLMDERMGASS